MKTFKYPVLVILLFVLAVFAWSEPKGKKFDAAKVRQAIEETNAKFKEGMEKKDAAMLASFYTEDATIMPPNEQMIKGRKAIQDGWQSILNMGIRDLTLTTLDVGGAGNTAYEVGTFSLTLEPPGQKPINDSGKYLVVWKRQRDDAWKLHVDIWNSSLPPPAQASGK